MCSPGLQPFCESLASAMNDPWKWSETRETVMASGLFIGPALMLPVWTTRRSLWLGVLFLCLTLSYFFLSERVRHIRVNRYREMHRMAPTGGEDTLTKEELRLKAESLGLNPENYDDEQELVAVQQNGRKKGKQVPLGITMRGQAVRCYERALAVLPLMKGKVRLAACGEYTVPIEERQTTDSHGGPVGVGDDIEPCSEQRSRIISASLPLQKRLQAGWKTWLGRQMSAANWEKHTGPVVWDIPCSAHPVLDEMADLYSNVMADELVPVGPAWDWLLQRPEERRFNHWSRQPLRGQDKHMWYALERGRKPPGHENVVFGRSEYTFGKWRLKKNIRKVELAKKMKPLFAKLGIEAEKNSGQFFYPPGGFRTWHTNVWDGLGFRGYIVHVDRDNRSALNVMKGDRMITCPDKARIFRLFEITGGHKPTWHSVVSDCHRYSLGVKIPDNIAHETLMPLANKVYQ